MIEDIIGECAHAYKLDINPENKETYDAFIERQLAKAPEKIDKAYKSLLTDKLLLFAYLIGEKPVHESRTRPPVKIKRIDQLHFLRIRGFDTMVWDDAILGQINCRRTYGKSRYGFPTYVEIIDELGEEPAVIKKWKRKITYKDDIRMNTPTARVKHTGIVEEPAISKGRSAKYRSG